MPLKLIEARPDKAKPNKVIKVAKSKRIIANYKRPHVPGKDNSLISNTHTPNVRRCIFERYFYTPFAHC